MNSAHSVSLEYETKKRKILPLDGPYVEYQNKKKLDFSSSDSLGLSQHPDVKKSAIKYTLKFGVRTVDPFLNSLAQVQIEEKLAQLLGVEHVGLFHSIEGAIVHLQSLFPQREFLFNPTLTSLKTVTKKQEKRLLIILPSSHPEKGSIITWAQEQGHVVAVDLSDSLGIQGRRGIGLLPKEIKNVILLGSFRQVGGFGSAFIGTAHDQDLYADSLTPSILGALDAILNLNPDMESEREHIQTHSVWLENQLKERGFDPIHKSGSTLTLTFISEKEGDRFWEFFSSNEIFLGRPSPSQVSFTLTALHTPDDLDQLLTVLKKSAEAHFALSTHSPTETP